MYEWYYIALVLLLFSGTTCWGWVTNIPILQRQAKLPRIRCHDAYLQMIQKKQNIDNMATYGKPQNKVDGTWMFSALSLQLFCEFENFLNETGQVPNVQSATQIYVNEAE